MKKIILILALVTSSSAFAQTEEAEGSCSYVCNSINSGSVKRECYNTTNSGFFQRSACNICSVLRYDDSNILNCVRAIKNKDYSSREINACSSISSNSGIVRCMQVSGDHHGYNPPNPPPYNPGRCDIDRLKRQTDGAISNYYGGNHQALINTLNNMKDELRSCR